MAVRQGTRAVASFARESIMVDHNQNGRWRRSADFCPIIHAIVHSLSSALRSASISPRRQARVPESASGKPQCARAFLLRHELRSWIGEPSLDFFHPAHRESRSSPDVFTALAWRAPCPFPPPNCPSASRPRGQPSPSAPPSPPSTNHPPLLTVSPHRP